MNKFLNLNLNSFEQMDDFFSAWTKLNDNFLGLNWSDATHVFQPVLCRWWLSAQKITLEIWLDNF